MMNVTDPKLKEGKGRYKYSIIEILQSNFMIFGLIFDKNDVFTSFFIFYFIQGKKKS